MPLNHQQPNNFCRSKNAPSADKQGLPGGGRLYLPDRERPIFTALRLKTALQKQDSFFFSSHTLQITSLPATKDNGALARVMMNMQHDGTSGRGEHSYLRRGPANSTGSSPILRARCLWGRSAEVACRLMAGVSSSPRYASGERVGWICTLPGLQIPDLPPSANHAPNTLYNSSAHGE